MSSVKKAVVAGSIGLDIIPVFPENSASNPAELFAQGRFNDMHGTRLYLGGCVGNTGIAMHKLGTNVTLRSKVGGDFLGSVIRSILERQGVPIQLDTVEGVSSTSTVVIAPFGGDRVLLHSRGASQTFIADDLSESLLKENDLLHFGYPTAMKYLYENHGAEFIKLVKKCRESGITVSVDTSQPDPNSSAGQADWKGILQKAMPYIDIFMPSLEEILFMLHRPLFDEINERRGSGNLIDFVDISLVEQLAAELADMGARIVLLKVGKKGLYLHTGSNDSIRGMGRAAPEDCSLWTDRRILCPPYYTDSIRSTTGAGDNAIAGFLAAFLNGELPEDALHIASENAIRCIESYETTDGIIPLEDLKELLKANPVQEELTGIEPGELRKSVSRHIFYGKDDRYYLVGKE